MTRNPPNAVKKALRDEVGFGCPVPGCGSPYLEWHHFDPLWHIEEHHRVEGMIALCRDHHIHADHGAFTVDQLHDFKRYGKDNWSQVKGRFNWMRNRLLAVVGGNFYYETPVVFQFQGKPVIWFERNQEGYQCLNLFMLTASGEPRAHIRNNDWFNAGSEEDIECPPSGKRLRIRYPNGDQVTVEFFEIKTLEEAEQLYPEAGAKNWPVDLPITAVEVTNVVAGTNLEFSAKQSKVGGIVMKNCFMSNCGAGIAVG
jgi:hypothetical protein